MSEIEERWPMSDIRVLRSNGTEFVLERSKLGLEAGGRRLPRPAPSPAITPPDYVLLGGTDQRSTNGHRTQGFRLWVGVGQLRVACH
jgi:hypothetical protein